MATLTTSYRKIAEKKIGNVYKAGEVTSKDLYLRIYAKCNSQDTANNRTSVSYKSVLYAKGSGHFYTLNTTTKSLSGTGATSVTGASAQGTYNGGTETTLSEITGTVTHSNDGTKSVSASASWTSTPWGISGSVSATATLPTIPRASSITSVNNITVGGSKGNSLNIQWTPASANFKYKIKCTLGAWSVTTGFIEPKKTTAHTYTYDVPSAVLSAIPNSSTATATAILYTYNSSGTSVGSSPPKTFTVTVDGSIKPNVEDATITLNPVNIKTADGTSRNILVKGKNKLEIELSGFKAGTGSGIKSYKISGPGINTTTTNTKILTSGTISKTGTLTYTVTVTDNRDRTASKTNTITCYAWAKPTITLDEVYRVASKTSTTENDSGTYVRCSYKLTYSSVNTTNNVTVKIYYKKNTSSSWSSVEALTDSTSKSGTYVLSSIDSSSTYTVYATITDNYSGSSSSSQVAVFGAARVMNIRPNGTGVAFGKMAESNNLFESRYKIKSPGVLTSRIMRPTNANTSYNTDGESDYLGTMEHYLASSSMTTNKPSMGDGHILHFHWDNTLGWDTQLYLHNGDGRIMSRGCNEGTWGDWRTSLDSVNYTSYVTQKPTTLYSSSAGSNNTITLSYSAADFTYLEIFYTDNNSRQPNSVKVYSPNGKYVTLCCVEPSTANTDVRVYIRSGGWTISGASMTPGRTNLNGKNDGIHSTISSKGTVSVTANTKDDKYIKIFRVLGYK